MSAGASTKQDKYSAVWTSYSSISDFLECPRAYYLNNVYKDPETRRKINLITPAMALGHAVHNTIEPLAKVPADKRMSQPIRERFEQEWQHVSGARGGFRAADQEATMKERGAAMLERVIANPGPLTKKASRIPEHASGMPPNFYLSQDDNIILCGKVDWLIYDEEHDGVHVLDFKTGKHDEASDSLQLPIYLLLTTHCQHKNVVGASYWYLDRADEPKEKTLPAYEEAYARVLSTAQSMKAAREQQAFTCPSNGCRACAPLERIVAGEATYLGVNDINQDMYAFLDA